jgi:hypothetical protein
MTNPEGTVAQNDFSEQREIHEPLMSHGVRISRRPSGVRISARLGARSRRPRSRTEHEGVRISS